MNDVNETLDYLKQKDFENTKYIISLWICSSCSEKCLNSLINNKEICQDCISKINQRITKITKRKKLVSESFNRIKNLFGDFGFINDGKRFILNIPPKSFRSLKTTRILKAFREMVNYRMKSKNYFCIKKPNNIQLYLGIHTKHYSIIDCDNVAKSICDALQGKLFENDSQIKVLICEKFKVTSELNEGIVISYKQI